MKVGLRAGAQSTVSFVVDKSMTAAFEGKTIHKVLSTFHLVYYAELAARKLVEPYLEEEEDAAGVEICLSHIAPTRIGEKVSISAVLLKIDGKRFICSIKGVNSRGEICRGTQTQVLVPKGSLD